MSNKKDNEPLGKQDASAEVRRLRALALQAGLPNDGEPVFWDGRTSGGNQPDMRLAFTCRDCGAVSYWTRNTRAPFCHSCRCTVCLTVMRHDGAHSWCPKCMVTPQLEQTEDEDGEETVQAVTEEGPVN